MDPKTLKNILNKKNILFMKKHENKGKCLYNMCALFYKYLFYCFDYKFIGYCYWEISCYFEMVSDLFREGTSQRLFYIIPTKENQQITEFNMVWGFEPYEIERELLEGESDEDDESD